jgi:tetratricopeptide (TPR) repeat protein
VTQSAQVGSPAVTPKPSHPVTETRPAAGVPAPSKTSVAGARTGAAIPAAPAGARRADGDARPAPRNPDDFQLALYYQRAGEFEQAMLHYKAALQRDEMNLEAHNNLGSLYLGRNLLEEAAREFQRVVAIEPKYATAHVNLAATLFKLGRFDSAAAEARTALQLEPRNGDAFVNLALAQKGSGQPGDARTSLRRALEIDAHNAAAHYNLARECEENGEVARALDHYRQFLQYAGPEQDAYAQDVRSRISSLQAKTK